ncbi:MAG TPA: hypothetical protein VHH32_08295 [Gemmatimonadales bacterium]|nr:hypothetical protein [Gemmatimonadales bacterium]
MRAALFLLMLAAAPGGLVAQSSQFGVRGLGYPGRHLATRSLASGGAFGLFDHESSLNPAALAGAVTLTSVFTISQAFGSQENPSGTASTRNTRFPQLTVVGPVRQSRAAVGLNYSNYTNRDFTLTSSSTVELRGVPVGITDTLSARGGISDLRLAGAYRLFERWTFGAAFHVITGSTRLELRRSFDDSLYRPSIQRGEMSYAGVGVSAGLVAQLASRLALATMVRWDGHANVDRDSIRVGTVDLPYSFGLGVHWQPSDQLGLSTQSILRTWSAANSDLIEQGGIGAENTIEVAVGAEYTPDPRQPSRRPIRVGARYRQLPFPLIAGSQGHEVGISAGSGIRFAQQRGGIDLALEHVWRSEEVYSERAFILSLGVSVRP